MSNGPQLLNRWRLICGLTLVLPVLASLHALEEDIQAKGEKATQSGASQQQTISNAIEQLEKMYLVTRKTVESVLSLESQRAKLARNVEFFQQEEGVSSSTNVERTVNVQRYLDQLEGVATQLMEEENHLLVEIRRLRKMQMRSTDVDQVRPKTRTGDMEPAQCYESERCGRNRRVNRE